MPSGPTRYWADTGCELDTRELHRDLRFAEDLAELQFDRLLRLVKGHADDADGPVGRPEVDHPLRLDHEVIVDRLVHQGLGDVDFEDIIDLRSIGGQRDHLRHLDGDDVRRLDAVAGQGDLAEFSGRDHGVGDGLIQQVVADLESLAAGKGGGSHGDGGPGADARQESQGLVMDAATRGHQAR